MRSVVSSILVGVLIIGGLGTLGYFAGKKLLVGADTEVTRANPDINRDGKVNNLDLNLLIKAVSAKSKDKKYDLNGDGKVDNLDVNYLSKNWKK